MPDAKMVLGAVGSLLGVLGLGYGVGTSVTKQALGTAALDTRLVVVEDQVVDLEDRTRGLPVGTIIAWNPVRTDAAGAVQRRDPIPDGWALCDGKGGRPNLVSRFLRGVGQIDQAGRTGGTSKIPSGGGHSHGNTERALERGYHGTQGDKAPFQTGGDKLRDHVHAISSDGGHDHGGNNLPPYYDVVFIIKVADAS